MSAKSKKLPIVLFLVCLVIAALVFFWFQSRSNLSLVPAPAGINLVGNGAAPEVTEGPASIFGRIAKSTEAGSEGTFVLISRESGALYELDLKTLDSLIGTDALVTGIVVAPAVPTDAPFLKVETITPETE